MGWCRKGHSWFSPRVDLENQTSTLCAGLDLSFSPLEMPYEASECTLAIG